MVPYRDRESGAFRLECLTERILLVLSGLVSTCLVGWALYFSRFGLDITDEGFYLTWLTQPFEFRSFISQFGFIYHPLYLLVGQDLVLLRQINVLLTYGLGTGLAYALMGRITPCTPCQGWERLIIAAGYGSAALLAVVIGNSWLPTPSYNTLAAQSLLLVAIGACLVSIDFTRSSIFGWILISVGGWLAFMAKPSTAAGLAVCVAVYLLLGGLIRWRFLVGLVVLTAILLVVSSYAVDGGLVGSVERIQQGLYSSQLLSGGRTATEILRLEVWPLSDVEKRWWFGATLFLWLWCLCASIRYKVLTLVSLAVAVVAVLAIFGIIFYAPLLQVKIGSFQHLLILAIPLAAVLYALTFLQFWDWGERLWRAWLLVVLLTVLPYAYVFGTNNNYWRAMGSASVFWVMAGLAVVCVTVRRGQSLAALLVLAIGTQAFVTLRLHASLETPYRQAEPLFISDHSFSLGHSKVIVEDAYGKYLQTALDSIENAGFVQGTPMIDLTGQSPGLLHIFGARSVGQAWMLGGYPGSYQFAVESLGQVDCSVLGEAWLLIEPNGPRSISTDVLQTFGADIQDYMQVVSWQTSPGAGGYKNVRKQVVYKPSLSAEMAVKHCQNRTMFSQ